MSTETLVAFGSLALAGLTVIVTALNVRYQTRAASALEHRKWLREKQDDVYDELIRVLGNQDQGLLPPGPERWEQVDRMAEAIHKAKIYASEAVLSDATRVWILYKGEAGQAHDPDFVLGVRMTAQEALLKSVRAELVGDAEAMRNWQRLILSQTELSAAAERLARRRNRGARKPGA